ncbi:HigA family addiction module antitoxin [Burkholderia multivorans]|uniref:HigA family addiction module antitoxin n=1 Tax=Burkholderia multivorans TaxID=87883 RepID=UPI000CFF3E50|nr:HigA family addiction module antitoxin [Burkholderia multivorans]MEB2487763.1 HigA family addiction module antitoxin [Burkholderia multivorans]MEB2569881.1 HigA family addiction module antitoxin [Burkholderia multivorans]PRF43178.1 addiction module antidote protein, HigA family [Burkholderia multivorans]PRG76651.1 addiction module antidote protein, HigA family [Burkholderia multivorans]
MDPTETSSLPQHPGAFVRDYVLKPKKLGVTRAAELVGVGRPAFSNFINGKAAATPEMAARLEVAFELEAGKLLALQAAFDAAQAKPSQAALSARRYVVPLMEFKANDFEAWVTNNVRARTRLPVLIRTLVNSTALPSTSDFPGNDDAERPGWDGWSECELGNPWVPAGNAGWEFGTNKDPKEKADGDYAKSVKAMPMRALRLETTFIFVTPRRWPGKSDWVNKKKAEKQWRDVRAYDAGDLEQWVAQSVSAQAWLAEELGLPTKEVGSLDDAWQVWCATAKSSLPPTLFDTAIGTARPKFLQWLAGPPEKPFVVASDSKEEALAFLSALLPSEEAQLASTRDRVVIFKAPGALTKLAKGATDFVAVALTDEVQQELAAAGQLHAVVVLPRNAEGLGADVVLEPLTSDAFRVALEGANYKRDEISRLAKESGRSLTVLRRRLSNLPAVQSPPWAKDADTSKVLIPLYLAGSWNSKNERDTSAVTRIAGLADGDTLESKVQEFSELPQAPVWSVSTYRGVYSKLDVMFATRAFVTPAMLKRFFEQAKIILEEDDPKLDLAEDKRWAAAIYNKSREYSTSLRDGVAESLVLLAVHGDALFGDRIGFGCNHAVEQLVEQLMLPLTARRLEAAGGDLLAYAEAAPETFLRILERDLDSPEPAVKGLLRPADTMFGGCPRTNLLWALEGLAWNPKTLGRSALLLAKLSRYEIRDNWSNKPMESLSAIFKAWIPQTAASLEERLRCVRFIAEKVPNVGWRLSMALLDTHDRFGTLSHKPRWRNDGYGHGDPLPTMGPILEFRNGVTEMVLRWSGAYSAPMICDLINVLAGLNEEQENRVWGLVQQWAKQASDQEKAEVREKVRVSVLSKRARRRIEREHWPRLTEKGRAAFKLLEPKDVVHKHAWLFKQGWVPDSADDLFGEPTFEEREKHIRAMRTAAVQEIVAARGTEGLRTLAEQGAAAEHIGTICAAGVLGNAELLRFACDCVASVPLDSTAKSLMAGLMHGLHEERRAEFLQALRRQLDDTQYLEFLLRAPFNRQTWAQVDQLSAHLQNEYWKTVSPWHAAGDDVLEAIRRLTAVGRPRAAFSVGQYQLKVLGPQVVYDMLVQIAQDNGDEGGAYKLEQYWLGEAFALLDSAPQLSLEQKAVLEFIYIDALWTRASRKDQYQIPNLEKYVEQNPHFYVQALVWAFRRRDDKDDPAELKAPEGSKSAHAQNAYKLLQAVSRLPAYAGEDKPTLENLQTWIEFVRTRARELGRLEVADSCLGRLLAAEPPGPDMVWPGQLARDALEFIATDEVASGAVAARWSSGGATWRARGGTQERERAAQVRSWENALQYSHPFVASRVLDALARSYERDAKREDESELLRERLE